MGRHGPLHRARRGLTPAAGRYALSPRAAGRVQFPRRGSLPPPEQPARLKLQVASGEATEREYRLLYALRASSRLQVNDDPEAWGEPTVVLDTADRTVSAPGLQSPSPNWKGPADLSARLWLRWDDQALHVGLKVRDDVACDQAGAAAELWQSDSVQYGFDPDGDADPEKGTGWDGRVDTEWLGGLFQGAATLWRHANPQAAPPGPVPGVTFACRREGDLTTYAASFPWSVLPPATAEVGSLFGFNVNINDNDGAGRKGWIGITRGMGEAKQPGLFRKVLLVG